MTKETRLPATGQGSTGSLTRHHASSKHVAPVGKVQIHLPRGPNVNELVTNLARLACIGAALFSFVSWHDLIAFLVLIAIAIDPRKVWEAVRLFTQNASLPTSNQGPAKTPKRTGKAKGDHS
jgi:hypothetical protein